MPDTMKLTITHGLDSTNYSCTQLGKEHEWAFPVGAGQYPPEMWYAAQLHSATHTGIDLNIDIPPYGDTERVLGLAVYSMTKGYVSYLTDNWSDVPMLVVHTVHLGKPLYIRYAHILPSVMIGESVHPGKTLGTFANWTKYDGGDHLHADCAFTSFTREWLDTSVEWVDIVDVMKEHLDPMRVDEMLAKGN